MRFYPFSQWRKIYLYIFILSGLLIGCAQTNNYQEAYLPNEVKSTVSSSSTVEVVPSTSDSTSDSNNDIRPSQENTFSPNTSSTILSETSNNSNEHKPYSDTLICSSSTVELSLAEISSSNPNKSPSQSLSPKQPIWGKSTDTLKTYADHDGVNQYKAYEITGNLGLSQRQSQSIKLDWSMMGSQFLTDLQTLTPLSEHPEPPDNLVFAQLYVVDSAETFRYDFYENNMVFTTQNNHQYYLGESYTAFSKIMIISNAILNNISPQQEKSEALADLHASTLKRRTVKDADIPQLTRTYASEQYNIAITFDDYGQFATPILIYDTVTKTNILNVLGGTWQYSEEELITGGSGPVIQIYNKNEHESFQVQGKRLRNNQIINNHAFLKLPDDFSATVSLAVARELASRY